MSDTHSDTKTFLFLSVTMTRQERVNILLTHTIHNGQRVQTGLILHQEYIPEKVAQIEHKISI